MTTSPSQVQVKGHVAPTLDAQTSYKARVKAHSLKHINSTIQKRAQHLYNPELKHAPASPSPRICLNPTPQTLKPARFGPKPYPRQDLNSKP